MNHLYPPRRAVFAVDPINRSWLVGRSPGWRSEASAQDVARLLDTDGASIQIEDLAGFFSLGTEGWAVVRGGLAPAPNPTRVYWREAIALGWNDLARVRFLPFRLLGSGIPVLPEGAGELLAPPELPDYVAASEDLRRIAQLADRVHQPLRHDEVVTLLAATLEGEHTLVFRSRWSWADLELPMLLLPPRLRPMLTFHSFATSLPRAPVPRLVLTELEEDWLFEATHPLWAHRLPCTRAELSPRAIAAARALLSFLDAPDRLVHAHEMFDRAMLAADPDGPAEPRDEAPSTSLLEHIERLLEMSGDRGAVRASPPSAQAGAARVAIAGSTGAAPRVEASGDASVTEHAMLTLEASLSEPLVGTGAASPVVRKAPDADVSSSDEVPRGAADAASGGPPATGAPEADASADIMLERLLAGYTPKQTGEAVAARLREPSDGFVMPAVVMERYFALRATSPAAFADFARAVAPVLETIELPGDDEAAQRIRTMRLLLACANEDPDAMASSLTPPIRSEVIARLGGAGAWSPKRQQSQSMASVLRAVAMADTPASAASVLRSLGEVSAEAPTPEAKLRLVDAGVEWMRYAFRSLHADQWEAAPLVATAGLELCHTATSAGLLALDGRSDNGTSHEPTRISAGPPLPPGALTDHSDAEVFLGLLGVDESRSRPGRWEIGERGDVLVKEVFSRVRAASPDGHDAGEGVHWSVAVIDRVRRGQLDMEFLQLAARLLGLCAPFGASRLLRTYFGKNPNVVPWLLDHPELRALLERHDLVALALATLDPAIAEAGATENLSGVATVCERLRGAGVHLIEDELRAGLEARLATVAERTRASTPRRGADAWLGSLNDMLTRVVAPEAQPALRSILLGDEVRKPEPQSGRTELVMPLPAPRNALEAAGISKRMLVAAGIAVLAGAALVANIFIRSAGSADGARGGGVAGPPAPPVVDSRDLIAADLAEARVSAANADWDRVLEVLSSRTPDATFPEAFSWDSMLAGAAFRGAEETGVADSTRVRLLRLTADRSARALEVAPPFGEGTDRLRLLRAEACISASLNCDPLDVRQDLILAARSTSPAVANRAGILLAEWK